MKFGQITLLQALGAILAHSLSTPRGMVKKGRALGPEDIAKLHEAGHEEVIAARLEPGDVSEDDAAARIARALTGAHVRTSAPFTGRANLFADATGLVQFDAGHIGRLNLLHEGITLATVSPNARVEHGQMLATVKIIPFAVPEAAVAEAEAMAVSARLAIAPFRAKRAGLILTRLPATKDTVLTKRIEVTRARLASAGSTLDRCVTVPHEVEAVTGEIARMRQDGLDPILIFAASAIVDKEDVIPAAVVAAGGEIVHLGMPVDPGNLLLTARVGGTDVLGMPSCAGSPKLNGFDWVLERRLAGLPAGRAEIAAMGVGGLLKEIASRPQPRDIAEASAEARRAPKIACIVLAAGKSSRMGAANKLEENWRGKPILRHVVDAAVASGAHPVVVVTGHRPEAARAAVGDADVTTVHNADYALGLSSSLRTGLDHVPSDIDGVIVALGDMPRISAEDLDRMIAAFSPKEGRAIVVPVYRGKRGNPILWAAEFLPDMRKVSGDTGAKHLLGENAERIVEIEFTDERAHFDVDTPEALARLREQD